MVCHTLAISTFRHSAISSTAQRSGSGQSSCGTSRKPQRWRSGGSCKLYLLPDSPSQVSELSKIIRDSSVRWSNQSSLDAWGMLGYACRIPPLLWGLYKSIDPQEFPASAAFVEPEIHSCTAICDAKNWWQFQILDDLEPFSCSFWRICFEMEIATDLGTARVKGT